jgi:hypothetical protein
VGPGYEVSTVTDELDKFIEEIFEDPEAETAFWEAHKDAEESWYVPCRYDNCMWFVHPVKRDIGGVGDPECKCEGGTHDRASS